MDALRSYWRPEYGFLVAFASIAAALVLRAMGILALTVSFWAGFGFCLSIEAFAVYYFLIKLEKKTEAKLEECVARTGVNTLV